MKKLMILSILTTLSLSANVSVNPGGKTYQVDAYGDSWQKAPTKNEVDPGVGKCLKQFKILDLLGD